MQQPTTTTRGLAAEEQVCGYLEERGFQLIARNVRYKVGEIDIVALDKNVLCFIEVRSKTHTRYGAPQETVNVAKQMKLAKAAQLYLKQHYQRLPLCRFDVVAVVGSGVDAKIAHFKNAFEVPPSRSQRAYGYLRNY